MIKVIICDFSRVILFPIDDSYGGSLNQLHRELSKNENYNALEHFRLNTELLDFFQSLADRVEIQIFTSDAIQDAPEFKQYLLPIFSKIHSATKMGSSKTAPESYKKIIEELQLLPNEVLYIDDNLNNLNAAKEAGLETISYTGNDQLFSSIKKKLTGAIV